MDEVSAVPLTDTAGREAPLGRAAAPFTKAGMGRAVPAAGAAVTQVAEGAPPSGAGGLHGPGTAEPEIDHRRLVGKAADELRRSGIAFASGD